MTRVRLTRAQLIEPMPDLTGVLPFADACGLVGADPVAVAATYKLAGCATPKDIDVEELLCVWATYARWGHRESVPYLQALEALRRSEAADVD